MLPQHVRVFLEEKLRSALRRAPRELDMAWGFVVHARRHQPVPTLGVVTLGGESLQLTGRLLAHLDGEVLWLYGRTPSTLSAMPLDLAPVPGPASDAPLESVTMHVGSVLPEGAEPEAVPATLLEAQVSADALTDALVFLLPGRPAGWPR